MQLKRGDLHLLFVLTQNVPDFRMANNKMIFLQIVKYISFLAEEIRDKDTLISEISILVG